MDFGLTEETNLEVLKEVFEIYIALVLHERASHITVCKGNGNSYRPFYGFYFLSFGGGMLNLNSQ